MKRALQLSLEGGPRVSPNPFVGAVIVYDDRIIGEGYHRHYGQAHAEVNAIRSVKDADRHLLKQSTIYVTLEPCSHYGKTPPCADLIIETGIPRVVIAIEDPFLTDYESGIQKMKNAGIEVEVGLMKKEAHFINRRFFTAHTQRRPFIMLKWAQSADGFIAGKDGKTVRFSNPLTLNLMHRQRAYYDAIMVGTDTIITDNPRLNCRLWPCRDKEIRPAKITFDSPRLPQESILAKEILLKKHPQQTMHDFLRCLYEDYKITSLLVEGGRKTLCNFINSPELPVDELRIETSPQIISEGVEAPDFNPIVKRMKLKRMEPENYYGNTITYFVKNY